MIAVLIFRHIFSMVYGTTVLQNAMVERVYTPMSYWQRLILMPAFKKVTLLLKADKLFFCYVIKCFIYGTSDSGES